MTAARIACAPALFRNATLIRLRLFYRLDQAKVDG